MLAPQVLCFSPSLDPIEPPEFPEVMPALAACWDKRCLPILVTAREDGPVLPGLLTATILSNRAPSQFRTVETLGPSAPPARLAISESVLKDSGRLMSLWQAGSAYLALAAAVLTDRGHALPHLERVARLSEIGPIVVRDGDESRPFRMLDLNASFTAEARRILFMGQMVPWDQRIRVMGRLVVHDQFSCPEEVHR